jgi:hypothetical protein
LREVCRVVTEVCLVVFCGCAPRARPSAPAPAPAPAPASTLANADLRVLRGSCALPRGHGCEEYHGDFSDAWLAARQADCRGYRGTWSNHDGCPGERVLGGCRFDRRAAGHGVEAYRINWQYARGTACSSQALRHACEAGHDTTFVPPAAGEQDLCDGGVP